MNGSESALSTRLRVMDIIDGTTVDGPGFRTSIYFAGCNHRCYGCHNPSTWPIDAGKSMSINDIMGVILRANFNVTFSGGDPMLQAESIAPLAKEIKEDGYNIWCYTGYMFEKVLEIQPMKMLLEYIDVLVDGPYIDSLRDTSLLFRGSSNQRLIDVQNSTYNKIRLWEPDF